MTDRPPAGSTARDAAAPVTASDDPAPTIPPDSSAPATQSEGQAASSPAGYVDELRAERERWDEIVRLVHALTPDERMLPGYFRDPDWSVRDLAAHLGTWLAEAHVQLERLIGGTYEGHEVDIEAMNAALLVAMADQPWEVVWNQANAARVKLLEDWSRLVAETAEATWWVRKAAGPHYDEHLPRLQAWVDELRAASPRRS